jgi:hypothetical protein
MLQSLFRDVAIGVCKCCMNVLGHVAIVFYRRFNHCLHMFASAFVLQYMKSMFMFAIIF